MHHALQYLPFAQLHASCNVMRVPVYTCFVSCERAKKKKKTQRRQRKFSKSCSFVFYSTTFTIGVSVYIGVLCSHKSCSLYPMSSSMLSLSSHHQIFCLEKKTRLSAKETHLMQHAAKREKEVQKGLSLKSQHAGKRGAGKKEKKGSKSAQEKAENIPRQNPETLSNRSCPKTVTWL
ncbi:uncharacterized protein BKA78DRAFT_40829 [Phyllosticta capitalensis]|uniref:uncharacterized protein n=1 Tax=Phyllosticta capitalensis TaxID=121624 RepID=UPI0031309001